MLRCGTYHLKPSLHTNISSSNFTRKNINCFVFEHIVLKKSSNLPVKLVVDKLFLDGPGFIVKQKMSWQETFSF